MAGSLLLSNIDPFLTSGEEELLKKTDVLANTFQKEKRVEDHLCFPSRAAMWEWL